MKKKEKAKLPLLKRDPIENDPVYQVFLSLADDAATAWMREQLPTWEPGYLSYGALFNMEKKRILKERYGINWKTPAEMNPEFDFD